jgi:hypothetical protein
VWFWNVEHGSLVLLNIMEVKIAPVITDLEGSGQDLHWNPHVDSV